MTRSPAPSRSLLLLPLLALACRTAEAPAEDASLPPAGVATSGAAGDLGPSAARPIEATAPREDLPAPQDETSRRSEVIELVRDGDYERAHDALDQLLIDRNLELARVYLAEGAPADALLYADRVLALNGRHPEGRLLKADGSLMLAEDGIAKGGSAGLIEGALTDALDYYAFSSEEPRALFGACRSAYLSDDTDEAVRWARRGRQALAENLLADDALEPLPHRILADAFFGGFTAAKTAEAPADEVQRLFFETEDALAGLLGRTPEDPWVWARFSDLYEWEERYALAREKLDAGIQRLPEDPGLLERLARVTRKESGSAGTIAVFADYLEAHPGVALGRWYLASELFEDALTRLDEGDAAAFTRAEEEFRRCRELDPGVTAAAMGYEVMCRNGRGWSAFNADDLETATREFLSMNELFDRGIEWSIEGRLYDGIMGLAFIGDQYNNREDWLKAGDTFELAHGFQPEEALWANNAGFFLRDAGVELELEGRRLCRAARGEITDAEALVELRALAGVDPLAVGTDAERLALASAANDRMERARSIMERSWTAYRSAAALSPDDVRVVNDAALVLVYYLGKELELAESYLLRCMEMGAEQVVEAEARLASDALTLEQRDDLESSLWELKNAWGDAYQNAGVLEFLYRDEDLKAIAYLERSIEIGPDPRPDISNSLLPLIRSEREPTANEFIPVDGWARPCELR